MDTVESTDRERIRTLLLFYLGVPAVTALLFAMNEAGMARHLPIYWAIPYWFGITIPLWALLDGSSRLIHLLFARLQPHRWLILFGGSLIAMAIFSFYLPHYVELFHRQLPSGLHYQVNPPFPEAFLDLRRFAAYSSVPIYWIILALFFARYFRFPPYLLLDNVAMLEPIRNTEPNPAFSPEATPSANELAARGESAPTINAFGLAERKGFRALLPFHLGIDILLLSAEDHYVRVVTTKGNALIRYRFSDALKEVRDIPGIQAHRSHWIATSAIERINHDGKTYRVALRSGREIPVSRTNVGLLKAAGLI